jgi:hypothetical protein
VYLLVLNGITCTRIKYEFVWVYRCVNLEANEMFKNTSCICFYQALWVVVNLSMTSTCHLLHELFKLCIYQYLKTKISKAERTSVISFNYLSVSFSLAHILLHITTNFKCNAIIILSEEKACKKTVPQSKWLTLEYRRAMIKFCACACFICYMGTANKSDIIIA